MLYGITKMRVGSMLNVYVICNNALVHKQYVIANSTERVQWFLLTTGFMTHADWLILGYTTVIIIFGIVCYIGLLKLITKGKHEK
ncbi:hypothetical protein CUC30_07370 [Salmonella enterica]|nr:hypothetical protein [Salmonella enterica]EBC5536923.1 hypothetical protein [Salmonella enterica]ECC4837588.1 hypothetical protein [Salmonella enterica]EDD2427726.1 hypothetical protein [Salmonella enterica]EGS3780991.1 hypothetical protein [Salmonella enterica]